MAHDATIVLVRNYLRSVAANGLPVRFGVPYGSHVTGRTHESSDIDLMVVSPRFDGERRREDIDLLWTLTLETDTRIEPIPCGERQWEEDDGTPIIEIARQRGERVEV